MRAYTCADCGIEEEFDKTGRLPDRCPECAKKRNRDYMREYMRKKNAENRIKKALENPRLIERIERIPEPDWDEDAIPDADDMFGHHFYDSGTGIDQGNFEG